MRQSTMRPRQAAFAAATLLGLVLALLPTLPARACSCAEPDLAPVLDGADDLALVLAERTDLDGGPEGTLRILEVLAGTEEVGPVEARFDDGASCDPWLSGGAVGALLLAREDERWTTTTCGTVPVGQALAATGAGLEADDDAGAPTLLVAGDFGGARLAAVDAAGRVAAHGGGDGRTLALASCPDDEVVVEIAVDDAWRATLQRWSLRGLEPVGDPVPLDRAPVHAGAARCLDRAGDSVVVALPRYGEPGAVGLVTGSDARLEPSPVVDARAAEGTMAAILADGTPQGQPHVVALVRDDGTVEPLFRREDTVLDRLAVSPSGQHVAVAGYPDDGGDRVVVATTDGAAQVDRTLDGFHIIGWLDDDRLWLREEHDLAYGAAATSLAVRGATLEDAGTLVTGPGNQPVALADGSILRLGGVVPSVLRGHAVHAVDDVRLAAAEHALVLDPSAVLTDAAPEPDPTPAAAAPRADAEDASRITSPVAPWLAGLALALVAGLAWAVRRARA